MYRRKLAVFGVFEIQGNVNVFFDKVSRGKKKLMLECFLIHIKLFKLPSGSCFIEEILNLIHKLSDSVGPFKGDICPDSREIRPVKCSNHRMVKVMVRLEESIRVRTRLCKFQDSNGKI